MEKRNIEIKVRLNRKEADNLFKRVKRSRLSREAYIRHLINDLVPQDAPPPDYYAMMQQLYRIGNNLNQIAKKAHTLTEQWNYTVGYSLRSVQKTSFDGVYSSVGDLATYEQWEYTMKDGTTVLLALQDEGRVIVDKEDCFVVVTAFGTPEDIFAPIPHDRAFVEAFCEAFDFSYQTQRVDTDKAYALQCEEEPHTYAALIQFLLEEHAEECPNLKYALIDINDDGVEELLLQSEGSPLQTAHDFDENMFLTAIGTRDGELVYFIGGGYLYLCQDNVVEMLSPFEGEEKSHDYYRYDRAFRMEPVDQIHVEDGKLYKWVPNSKISDRDLEEITEAEADAIIAKHPRVDIEFKPAEEFPAQ